MSLHALTELPHGLLRELRSTGAAPLGDPAPVPPAEHPLALAVALVAACAALVLCLHG